MGAKEVSSVTKDPAPRVLVVDDEPSIVDAVATSLRYEGFEVDVAVTGRDALSLAQDDPPDLVILDVMLPGLDGLEVTPASGRTVSTSPFSSSPPGTRWTTSWRV